MTNNNIIFSLDIGTRKVAGVVLEQTSHGLAVKAAKMLEHPDRAMLDGQVHKIEAVADVVKCIKTSLEKEVGYPLDHAAVAAAGRALLTESYEKKYSFTYPAEVTGERVRSLELDAARTAQSALQAKEKNYQLHCVGYSAVYYTLDGHLIDDLVGHLAKEISVKVIATFLPRQVVDSMLTVMRKANSEATSLTLEPIAAIEATIPSDMRRMNLALIDIGAGTSDIALTKNGSVFAYDMVTIAGDEVTEFLCDHFLLEFNEAERIKRIINQSGDELIEYQTLLNHKQTVSKFELQQSLEPVITRLAQAIVDSLLNLNENPPRAIILVGGGSATPGLDKKLSELLQISEQRIGIRGPETITSITNQLENMRGIEWVTPLGIALTASRNQGLSFKKVSVNHQVVQLLALNQYTTVFDALLTAGHETRHLLPRPGQAITYTLAGKLMTVPGQPGEPIRIMVNNQPATLDTEIKDNDELTLTQAKPGKDAQLVASQIRKPVGPGWCTINDVRIEFELKLFDGIRLVEPEENIQDRANLNWLAGQNLIELIPELGQMASKNNQFLIKVNGKEKKISEEKLSISLDGHEIESSYRPKPGDRIKWLLPEEKKVFLHELVDALPQSNSITVTVNGQAKTIDAGGSRVLLNGQESKTDVPVKSDDDIQIETKAPHTPLLSQVLEGIKPHPKAGPIKIKVNGQAAGYATPLNDGANIEISFE